MKEYKDESTAIQLERHVEPSAKLFLKKGNPGDKIQPLLHSSSHGALWGCIILEKWANS